MASKTEQLLRDQFEELTAKREAVLAVSVPLREARDAFKNEALAKVAEMDVKIKEAEVDLYDLNTDLGRLARALGGRAMSEGQT